MFTTAPLIKTIFTGGTQTADVRKLNNNDTGCDPYKKRCSACMYTWEKRMIQENRCALAHIKYSVPTPMYTKVPSHEFIASTSSTTVEAREGAKSLQESRSRSQQADGGREKRVSV